METGRTGRGRLAVTLISISILVLGLAVSGCAVAPTFRTYPVHISGTDYTYVVGQSYCPGGFNMMVVDRYDGAGALVARDSGFTDGWVLKALPAAVHGGLVAGGMVGAAALWPGNDTNVSQTGGNAVSGSSSGSSSGASSNSTASSSSTSSSSASQSQGQNQGQSQGQGQIQGVQVITASGKGGCGVFKKD